LAEFANSIPCYSDPFTRPRAYSQPSFECSVLNIGPGAISLRFDGQDTQGSRIKPL